MKIKSILLVSTLITGISGMVKAEPRTAIIKVKDQKTVRNFEDFLEPCLFLKQEYCPSLTCDVSTEDNFKLTFENAQKCYRIETFYYKLLDLDTRIQEYRNIENKAYESGKKICHPEESYLPKFSELSFIENYERRQKSIHRYAETNLSDMSITVTEQYIKSINACIDDMNKELGNSIQKQNIKSKDTMMLLNAYAQSLPGWSSQTTCEGYGLSIMGKVNMNYTCRDKVNGYSVILEIDDDGNVKEVR